MAIDTEFAVAPDPVELPPRELEVLGDVLRGLTNREIAHHLHISTNTVNKHVHQVPMKL